jgi:hypothetical protein
MSLQGKESLVLKSTIGTTGKLINAEKGTLNLFPFNVLLNPSVFKQ